MTVRVPNGEEMEQRAKSTKAEVSFVRRVSGAEQTGSFIGAVNAKPSKYQCSTSVIFVGGQARGKCVLQTVLSSGSDISIIEKTGLHRLQRQFSGLSKLSPYEGGLSVTVTDGRGKNIS